MTDWFHNPDFLRIYHSADKEWPGFEVPGNENASLPLLISEVYRLIPYIGSEYVHFHPKNMPDVKIDKIEIIGIVTDKIELQKYISYTVDDSTGIVPVLCPKKPVNEDESTDSQESSDDESFAHKEKKLELKPPFGLAPSAPYSYQTHIQSLWFQARGKEFCYDEVLLYDYVHVIGFCAMDIRHQKNVSKLTNDDIELGRLFMFGMNLRKISEADHNAMTKSLITRVARQRYVKPKVE
ncbi:uncharacterized protein [Neodiprion pinetum]|uniref:uncharacterized protein isoform X4 n=1 Tax=Neodiprion pinetum TaxID=441929 RepID=UPI00371F11A6